MFVLDGNLYLDRKEVALLLGTSIHVLEVWANRRTHNLPFNKFRSGKRSYVYYKLEIVKEHFQLWDPLGYEQYYRDRHRKLIEEMERMGHKPKE